MSRGEDGRSAGHRQPEYKRGSGFKGGAEQVEMEEGETGDDSEERHSQVFVRRSYLQRSRTIQRTEWV